MSKSIKQIKKELGIGNRDVADAFGYKNDLSYNSSGKGKKRIEAGLEWFYSKIMKDRDTTKKCGFCVKNEHDELESTKMKATELRIGNLVCIKDYSDTPHLKVESVGNLIQVGGQLWSIEELQPIALTEELLERFGFSENTFSQMHELNNFCGEFCYNAFYVILNNVEYDIKYVHQLQNLYFTLTGEELTIK